MRIGGTIRPIGVVHRKESDDEVRGGARDAESTVEIHPRYRDALDGLEGFSHIFVLGFLHRLRPEQIGRLKVRPRKLVKHGLKPEDLPLVGVLALDSPTRPNPIGLDLVRLLRIEAGRKLVVSGLDFFDGTPVLDIKPYQPQYRVEKYTIPRWYEQLRKKTGHV